LEQTEVALKEGEVTVSEFYPTQSLKELDPFIHDLIRHEAARQQRKLIFIASESLCPPPVREALASEFSNIYAEGYPSPRTYAEPPAKLSSFAHQLVHFRRLSNRRYYKGCEYVDILESVTRRRTAELFATDRFSADKIFVNVQPLSGAAANNAVYNAFCKPGDTVMGALLTHGGHLTHGSKVNRSGANFNIVSYQISRSGKMDYDAIEEQARQARPKILIGGFSAYPYDVDWARMRKIADACGAILLADIAHLAGMVAAGLLNNPVGYAHVVSFTTHKTLCGPRGAMLLSTDPAIAAKLDFGVFPGEQGGPHIHVLAAKAVAMAYAKTEAFRTLQRLVLANAQALAKGFQDNGLTLAYGGTNTHMCLIDLRTINSATGEPITGEICSRLLDLCGIVCNKNTIAGDTNAIHPSGLRFGTTWVSQRGLTPEHMTRVAALVARVVTSIKPFSYIGGRIEWSRGKVDPAVLEEVSAGVRELVAEAAPASGGDESAGAYPHFIPQPSHTSSPTVLTKLHKDRGVTLVEQDGWLLPAHFGDVAAEKAAIKSGAALVDNGGALLLEISMGRPGQLLENALTSNVLTLTPGQTDMTLLLEPSGRLMAQGQVMCLPPDAEGNERYWLRLHTSDPDHVTNWLRGLSDGYFLHDEDLQIKCEGPAVIEDLAKPSDGRPPLACIGLRGPKAGEIFQASFNQAPPAPGWIAPLGSGAVQNRLEDMPGLDLFIPAPQALGLWAQINKAGTREVGCQALAEVATRKADASGDLLSGPLAKRIQLNKPFFIGQKSLRAAIKKAPNGPAPFTWTPPSEELKQTCLYAEHEKLTSPKHIVPFAGWRMPVMYRSILDEHEAVRNRAGLFDVTHMGALEFSGPFAERFLDLTTANYVSALIPGQAHYSFLLDHAGRCIDDLIIYRISRDRFMVVVNAANAYEDEAWFRAVAEGRVMLDPLMPDMRIEGAVTIRNLKDPACGNERRVDLALQGPASRAILEKVVTSHSARLDLMRLRKFQFFRCDVAGIDALVSRTGYTGEDIGFELYVNPERASTVWNALLEAGKPDGLTLAGLGARDSTRTEAGLPLHGHELAGPNEINPVEAGYGSFVKLHKPFFVGRESARNWHAHRERLIVRFEVDEKGGKVLRPGNPVLEGRKGEYSGIVTSATSTGERQVGLALINARHAKKGGRLMIVPLTEHDASPPARTPREMKPGDWMAIPRTATIRERFMKAGEKPLSPG
jgi:glycine cleavage system T protein